MTAHKYEPLNLEEGKAAASGKPQQWPSKGKGSGQFEYQGFEEWTPEEQKMFDEGKLTAKWGFGQVSIRLPIASPVAFIAIVYGYLPFIIPIWWAVWALVTYVRNGSARFFPLCGITIAASFALVNELITKQICKRVLPETVTKRPPEAVCKHPGMPSGHVMNAYTLMTWCFLEAAFDQVIHFEWLLLIVLVMGPVPWARVYNRDHTFAQVMTSAIVAVVMGSIAYYMRKTRFPHHYQPWDWYSIKSFAFERDD